MKIYIIAHKQFNNPTADEIYCPIQVGAELHDELDSEWEKDNTGDHISEKNLSYNELTGLYWIWKNSNEDIVGLCHYRRYFVKKTGKIKNLILGKSGDFLQKEDIERILSKNDLIVHNKTYFMQGCRQQYLDTQKYPEDIKVLRKVLKKYYPEYVDAYDEVMKGRKCHLLNMMIGKKEVVDNYCEWLFDVLFKVEKYLKAAGETSFERRMGMLGERMLDIWIVKNNIKVKEVYSINTERKDWKVW
ncbi:MAG: DUF4422 domain-containing protein [Lachnospiraceae bacterium]|nr:DUF4422 domain-containing protein [Lachnospiraceae bacterium]